MSDRYKFRVWDKEKQEYIKYPMYLRSDGTLLRDEGGAYTQLRKAGDRFVVEFYTGLKDKTKWRSLTCEQRDVWRNAGNTSDNWNGVEIYGKSKVVAHGQTGVIEWSDESHAWHIIFERGYAYLCDYSSETLEVIHDKDQQCPSIDA